MCELCICVVDRSAPDPALDSKLPKRGVVIEAFPDGHGYGAQELAHPMFRILKLPGVPVAFGRAFLGGEPGDPAANPNLLARQFKLDIDAASIPAGLAAHLADATRAAPAYTVDLAAFPLAAITLLKTKRASLAGAAVGQPGTVIG